jgi:protoheme IX farnesyltransferase
MKTAIIDFQPQGEMTFVGEQLSRRERAHAYLELTKPRIATMIVLIAAAGFYLGSAGGFDYTKFFFALTGIALLSGGIATLNQFIERDLDKLMQRTSMRPLPANRLPARSALIFGLGLTVLGEIILLVLVNPLTALLGLLTAIGYVLFYTPLKTRTSLSTWLGAFPGAVPPLIGFAAAQNRLSLLAWVLFAIQFLWQFPHFLAIAWMYREDYGRASIKMLPVTEPTGIVAGIQIVLYALLLVPVSLLPVWLGIGGRFYFLGALVLGGAYFLSSIRAALSSSREDARRLLLVSVIYLPLLFTLLVVNR